MKNLFIVSSDHHVPFHNKKLMKGFMNLISDLQPKLAGFYLIGDFMDINSLSFHDIGRIKIKGINLKKEFEIGNSILNEFDERLGKVPKYYLYGNHEDRALRHLKTVDGAKLGDLIHPTVQLNLKERGYQVKENWKEDYFMLGNFLELIHGQYLNIHVAKKHIDVFKSSVMFGHTHRKQTYIEGNMGGFNIGHMADENQAAFSYQSRGMKKRHLNGFAIVTIDKEGFYYVNDITAFKDKFYYNGKKYGG